jgi:sec-independent protein translocase protein TatB
MAGEFQGQFQEAMREAELTELKKEVDEMTAAARGYATDFDPVARVRKEMDEAMEGKTPPPTPAAAESTATDAMPVAAPNPIAGPAKPQEAAETPKPGEGQRG